MHYEINKGINRSIEFKGLRAQYIWYMGGGGVVIMLIFAAMYLCGISSLICVGTAIILGTGLVTQVYKMSRKYGEHGLMKMFASKRIPKCVSVRSRRIYMQMGT